MWGRGIKEMREDEGVKYDKMCGICKIVLGE
jgi:hypothetical protein